MATQMGYVKKIPLVDFEYRAQGMLIIKFSEEGDRIVKAVQSKNADAVIKASREIGRTCNKCHQENQAVVKLYHHFPRYDNIKQPSLYSPT